MKLIQLSDRVSIHRIATIAALIFGAPLAQAQTYRVTDLGVIPGQTISHPAGINQNGQVAGYSGPRAARFTHGLVEDLGTLPGGAASSGVAINDQGQVVGDSQYQNSGSIRHATLFSNGTATDLGVPPTSGNYSRATGINEATQVVGYAGPSLSTSNTRAFIWDAANGMQDLGTLGGQWAKAFGINDSGVVTGTSQATSGGFHAFIWTATGGMQDIGTIAGNTSSGNFINDNGHVAGTSTINGFDNRQHAFLYDGVMHDLGAIGNNDFFSDRSSAHGVNIHDHVVGTTYRPYTGGALFQIAFVYRDGQMFDLETLVDASGADYRLYTATGINDAGQIAVDAIRISTNQIHAVLLTPNEALPFCFGDGTGPACPCANTGSAGHGCENSAGTGGALLTASGSASPDTIVFTSSGELPTALSVFLQGDASNPASVRFGDGVRCVAGNLKRLYTKNASAGVVSAPTGGDPSVTAQSATLGDTIAPGSTRHYQVYYRDPNLGFCPSPVGDSFNISNGLSIVW